VNGPVFTAQTISAVGAAACAIHGNPAMAAVFIVLLLLASAIGRLGRRLDDIEESLLDL
jgi:hypothetical protein